MWSVSGDDLCVVLRSALDVDPGPAAQVRFISALLRLSARGFFCRYDECAAHLFGFFGFLQVVLSLIFLSFSTPCVMHNHTAANIFKTTYKTELALKLRPGTPIK